MTATGDARRGGEISGILHTMQPMTNPLGEPCSVFNAHQSMFSRNSGHVDGVAEGEGKMALSCSHVVFPGQKSPPEAARCLPALAPQPACGKSTCDTFTYTLLKHFLGPPGLLENIIQFSDILMGFLSHIDPFLRSTVLSFHFLPAAA